jgi:hypothetical protein
MIFRYAFAFDIAAVVNVIVKTPPKTKTAIIARANMHAMVTTTVTATVNTTSGRGTVEPVRLESPSRWAGSGLGQARSAVARLRGTSRDAAHTAKVANQYEMLNLSTTG